MKNKEKKIIIFYVALVIVGIALMIGSFSIVENYYRPGTNGIGLKSNIAVLDLYGKRILYLGMISLLSGVVGLFLEKYKKKP